MFIVSATLYLLHYRVQCGEDIEVKMNIFINNVEYVAEASLVQRRETLSVGQV